MVDMDYELLELKREFLAEADGKVREIQNVLDGERDSKALDRLAYLAHQLKGSGGSYGYARISSDAAELEKGVERIAGGESADALEAKLQQHALNLRTEIDKATRELAIVKS